MQRFRHGKVLKGLFKINEYTWQERKSDITYELAFNIGFKNK